MFKCILVGFESNTVHTFKAFVEGQFKGIISVEDTFESIAEFSTKVHVVRPDVVYFDIGRYPSESMDYLQNHMSRVFEVVFVGNSNDVAIRAFKLGVLDFYSKPFLIEDFERTLNKLNQKQLSANLLSVCQNRIGLPTNKGVVIMDPKEISYCEGSSNYSVIHLKNKKSELISRTLREVENVLNRYNFYRIHKSYLVNFYEIGMLIKSEGGHVIMNDYPAVMLPVSKHVREDLQQKLNIV